MFFKEKGFYISLLCGVAALGAFGIICYNLMAHNNGEMDGEQSVAEASATPGVTKEPETREVAGSEVSSEVKAEKDTEKKQASKKKNKTVETNANPVKKTLHFNQEAGLLWPVEGKILMEYSADQVVYFKTLAQYRTNPAVLIEAKEGDAVRACADGKVTDISTSEETGRTLTMSLGDDITVSYGQLKEIGVKVGDGIMEGQIIAKVAAPTKYYSLEGTNLYFQVKEKDKTVNPMVLLR